MLGLGSRIEKAAWNLVGNKKSYPLGTQMLANPPRYDSYNKSCYIQLC